MAAIRQSSFAAGELTPTLWGRTDLDKYAVGLKRCLNFMVSRQGAAVSRPGTKLVAPVKDSSTGPVRLVPFVFSDEQSFVLEFGNNYIRFYTGGGQVQVGGVPYEVATTYLTSELPRLKFSQVGDVITITHQSHPPQELRRLSNTNWTLVPVNFSLTARFVPGGVGYYLFDYTIFTIPLPAPYNSAFNYAAGAEASNDGVVYRSLANANLGHGLGDVNSWAQFEHPISRYWTWGVSALFEGSDGLIRETEIYIQNNGPGPVFLSTSYRATLVISSNIAATVKIRGYKIYRGLGTQTTNAKVLGLVGTQDADGRFEDVGDQPDYSRQAPQGYNPFYKSDPAGTPWAFRRQVVIPGATGTADNPSCVSMFEQRRVFASTPTRPNRIFFSVTGDYIDFDQQIIQRADTSLEFELASSRLFVARSLVDISGKLVAFGNSGIWSIAGHQGPLSYDSVDAKPQVNVGASWLTPLVVNNDALYAKSLGVGVSSLAFDYRYGKFNVSDISILSEHLFIGKTIVDWAYAEVPWGMVWAVRSDGHMLSLSYLQEQGVMAWAEHSTGNGSGAFESVCSVPEGLENAVYVAVWRSRGGVATRFIERMTDRVVTETTDAKDVICLDCAITYSGSATTAIVGLDLLAGFQVYALADGFVQGPFTVSNTGTIALQVAASTVHVGIKFNAQLQPLAVTVPSRETRTLKKTVTRVTAEVYLSRGFYAGDAFDNLYENQQRVVSDSFGEIPLESGQVEINIGGGWDVDGTVAIQQSDPLPLTILAFTRDVETSDY